MLQYRTRYIALTVCILFFYGHNDTAAGKTWRLKAGKEWQSVATDPEEQYLHAIAEIKRLIRAGESKAAKEMLKQIKAEFPDRVGPDLDLLVEAELYYWDDRYGKALTKYEKLLKDYPGSEFAEAALDRQYTMADSYLHGRKKRILGLISISGYAEGIEVMETISDRAGLDEPDSIGLKAAIAVAEHFERTEQYVEAYLKWSEIASYWETGPIGKRAIYRMAENNVAAYNQPPAHRRALLDASKLTTARSYYERFLALYPADAAERHVPDKIKQIDEQMAYKQLTIGQYYQRTGEPRAAHLYFEMVVQNWPGTEAADTAQQILQESISGERARGR